MGVNCLDIPLGKWTIAPGKTHPQMELEFISVLRADFSWFKDPIKWTYLSLPSPPYLKDFRYYWENLFV